MVCSLSPKPGLNSVFGILVWLEDTNTCLKFKAKNAPLFARKAGVFHFLAIHDGQEGGEGVTQDILKTKILQLNTEW